MGGEEREQEGDTRHTNPSLLPAPLFRYDRLAVKNTNIKTLIITRASATANNLFPRLQNVNYAETIETCRSDVEIQRYRTGLEKS